MDSLLHKFDKIDVNEAALKVKEFNFDDSQEFRSFVWKLATSAFTHPELSLKFAKLAKELELFSIPLTGSEEKTVNFRDELLKNLHTFEDLCKNSSDQHQTKSVIIFIGNLFNTDFLSRRLLHNWLSNLIAWKREFLAEVLAKTVQTKLDGDNVGLEDDPIMKRIAEMINGLEWIHDTGSSEEEGEGACFQSAEHQTSKSFAVAQSKKKKKKTRRLFRKFLKTFKGSKSQGRVDSFDYSLFDENSKFEREACAQMLAAAAITIDCKSLADITIRTGMKAEIEKTIAVETKLLSRVDYTKMDAVNNVVAFGAFIGELFNKEFIQSSPVILWMQEIMKKLQGSDVAVITFLLIFWKVHNKLKTVDEENHGKLMEFVEKVRDGNEAEVQTALRVNDAQQKQTKETKVQQQQKAETKKPKISTANLINEMIQGEFSKLRETSFDGKALASSFFNRVCGNFDLIFVLTKAAKKILQSTTQPSLEFQKEICEICVSFFDGNCAESLINATDNVVRFIAHLYNSDFLDEASMQKILSNMNSTEILEESDHHKRFKAIIPFIKEKAKTKSHETNPSLDEVIEEFQRKFGELPSSDILSTCVVPPIKDKSKSEFVEVVKKVLAGKSTENDFEKIPEDHYTEFVEHFIESACNNPEKCVKFAEAVKSLSVKSRAFRNILINSVQKRFEANLRQSTTEVGLLKFLGEIFNSDILTSKIILSCIKQLEDNLKGSSKSLKRTIAGKVIRNQDQTLLEHFNSKELLELNDKAENLSEPSKFVQHFCGYLMTKSYHSALETFIIEGFKTCKEIERHQCADLMMKIATFCPEKSPIFARICRDFSEMTRTLNQLVQHFDKCIKEKLVGDFSELKNGKIFVSESKKFGKIFEEQLKYDIEDFETIKLWVEKIFTKSKLKSELAVDFLTCEDKSLSDDEQYQEVKKNMLENLPWLQKIINAKKSENSSDEEEESLESKEIKFETIFKPLAGAAILHSDIKQYLIAKRQGENVIFDHRKFRNTSNVRRKEIAKTILEDALIDIKNVELNVLLIREVYWVQHVLGNFLRIMLDEQHVITKEFAKEKCYKNDLNFVSDLGNFQCDLYICEVNKINTMTILLDALLGKFERVSSENFLNLFLKLFGKISDAMQKRDLKSFEKYVKKIEEISIRDDICDELLEKVQNTLQRNQSHIWRSSDAVNIPNLIQQIKNGRKVKIPLEDFLTEDLKEFASCCVDEVVTNPNSKDKILEVILGFKLMQNSFKSSAHRFFRGRLSKELVNQYEGMSSDLDGFDRLYTTENIALSEFVAELFKTDALLKTSMVSIMGKIKYPEDFKTLFFSVAQKIEEIYNFNKFDKPNEFLHQKMQNFRARLKEIEIEEREIAVMASQEASTSRACTSRSASLQNSSQDAATSHASASRASSLESSSQEVSSSRSSSSNTGAIPKRSLQPEVENLTVNEFSIFLQKLSTNGNDKLLEIISRLNAKSQNELSEFAFSFFEARKFVKNFSVHVRLAQTIELEIFLSDPEKSFKTALLTVVQDYFLSLPTYEAILGKFKKNQTEVLLSLAGELYNIAWINDEEIFEVFDKFFKETFDTDKLRHLLSLLKIVSVKMIENSVGGQFEIFGGTLRKIRENLIDIQDHLTCDEILEIFETVEKLSQPRNLKNPTEKPVDIDSRQLENLLKNFNSRTFCDVARKLRSKIFKNDDEIIEFAGIFIKSMLESSQLEEKFAQLAVKIENGKFKGFLVNELQHVFLDSFEKIAENTEKSLKLVVFIGELYNLDFIDNDSINLILEVLFGNEKSNEEVTNCIDFLIQTAGPKLDEKNKVKMDRFFAFLKFVVESEGGRNYRSRVYKNLLALRVKKVEKVCDDEEIEAIWKKISENHEEIENFAQLCSEISARSNSNFQKTLTEFISKQPLDGENVNKILFIAELYKHELISDEVLSFWIKPKTIKPLPTEIITKIINSISSSPNVHFSVQTIALLMSLEEIVEDESEKACVALKEDLMELVDIINWKKMETA